jgi:hypothetical protein
MTSFRRLFLLTAVAAFAIAGCSSTPLVGPATTSPSPSSTPRFGAFHGSTTTTTFTSSGGTQSLSAYRGYSITATWGVNNATTSFTVTVTDATDGAPVDIDNPFTPWPGPGTGFLYLDIVNNGSQDVTFNATPAITITSTNSPAYPGTSCNFIVYSSNGGTNSWQIISTSPVTPSGGTLSFPAYTLGGGNTVDLQPGVHQYPGFECQ